MLNPARWIAWAAMLGGSARGALYWASQHTGLPVLVIAAIALVASWHMVRRALRFAVQVAVTAALLVVATKLGLLAW
jgi:hypothetical protein